MEKHLKEKEQLLQEIEFEFHHLQTANSQEKDFELSMAKEKLSTATRRVEELQKNEDSLNIIVSEQKVRIKNL